MLEITNAQHLHDHVVKLEFNNGRTGIADLHDTFLNDHRSIFQALQRVENFKQFHLDHHTLVWANELDLAPEYLYFQTFKQDASLHAQFKEWGYIH